MRAPAKPSCNDALIHRQFGRSVVPANREELKRTQAQLNELSQRLTYHVDHSPLAVIEWGPDMRLTRWSGEAERMFGWRAEEVLGKRMEDFRWIHNEDLQQVAKVSAGLKAGEVLARFSANRNYRKDASVIHCQWYNSSLLDEQGNVQSILSLVLDVTERVLAEESLRQTRDELEQRVQERTAELAETVQRLNREMEERLRAEAALQCEHQTLRRLLQAQDRQRQTISLGIHDGLAQPLTSATMHLQAADGLKSQDPAAAAEAQATGLAMLRASIDEARRLISDVRPPILDDEGIEAAIAHLAYEFRGPAAPHIEFSIDATFGRLDPALENAVYRIAQEGLANACRHSRSKRARIELLQRDDRLLRIEIQDWGVGFDPQAPGENCFGLDEIRQRASLLGGTAAILSSPGKGTQIVVELPIRFEQ